MSTLATSAKVLWLRILVRPIAFCALAAFVVSSGFGSAFVQDAVAAGVTVYCAAFVAIFFGVHADCTHWSQKRGARALFAALCGLGALYLFRTVALFQLPWSEYEQSGFSPYVVLIVGGALPVFVLEAIFQLSGASRRSPVQSPVGSD